MKISKKLRTAVALSLVMGGVYLFGCGVADAGYLRVDSSNISIPMTELNAGDQLILNNAKNIALEGVKDWYTANGQNKLELYVVADSLASDLLARKGQTDKDVIYVTHTGEGYLDYLFKYYDGTNGFYLKTSGTTNLTTDEQGYALVKHDKDFYFIDNVGTGVGVITADPKVGGSNVYITYVDNSLAGKFTSSEGSYGTSTTLDLTGVESDKLAGYEDIYGALDVSSTGAVSGAKLIVNGQTLNGVSLYGGKGYNHTDGNEVVIQDSTLGSDTSKVTIMGGSGYGTGNKVTIESGTIVADQIIGGFYNGGASDNTVDIAGGNVTAEAIYGGSARDGYSSSSNNEVHIHGDAVVSGNVYAGGSNRGNTSNKIIVKDNADLTNAALNGFKNGYSSGGNTLTFEDYTGTVKSVEKIDALNIINSSDIKVTGNLDLSDAFEGNAKVVIRPKDQMAKLSKEAPKLSIITAANIKEATNTTYYLGQEDPGNVVTNGSTRRGYTTTSNGMDYARINVNITNTEVSLSLDGDHVLAGDVYDDGDYHKHQDLKITNDVAGYDYIYGSFNPIYGSNNSATVTLDTQVNLPNTTIGGNNHVAEFSGCILNVSAKGSAVKNLKNFETLNFVLPADIASGDTMLSLSDSYDMNGVKNVGVDGSAAADLHEGDSVNLLTAKGISNYNANVTLDGTLVSKEAKVEQAGNALRLSIKDEQAKPGNSKAPVEAVAASVAAINEGADLVAGGMMENLSQISGGSDLFGAIGGSKNKYKTGSHVESNSWNIGLGMGKVNANDKNTISTGIFFEYGKSDFDTYNASLKGDGKAFYRGAGLLGRVDNHSGNYFEGSIRAGRASSEWSNSDAGRYDDSATYFGAHLGYGHKLQVGSAQKLDMYGKYFYSHLGSMEGKLKEADYQFDSVNTHRVRVGARMEYELKGQAKPYFGLAYEHTFNGDANATMRFGSQTDNPGTPSVQGNTGILEAGCKWTGNKVDWAAGVEGYTGVRKGISGNVNVNWKF